jgi:hypothetical protein
MSQRLILVLQRHIHISFSSFLISLQHASVCNSVIKDFLDHPRKSTFNMEAITHTRQDIFSYVNGYQKAACDSYVRLLALLIHLEVNFLIVRVTP